MSISKKMTVTRRTMLSTTIAGASALAVANILPTGIAKASARAATSLGQGGACHHTHAFQVSALMTSMGSPVVSSAEKSDLLAKAACPSCGAGFSADLMAEMACQSVSLSNSCAVSV